MSYVFSAEKFQRLVDRSFERIISPRKVTGMGGKVFGYLLYEPEDQLMVYYTPRTAEHLYIKGGPSWGISDEALETCKKERVDLLLVRYEGKTGVEWFAEWLTAFLEKSFSHTDEQTGEPQHHLPLKKWSIHRKQNATK